MEVKTAEEILSTLDGQGNQDNLPFMPEMLQYCGKRFRVYKSAHKACDTLKLTKNRRMSNAVPRMKPAAPEMSRICPKFGLDGFAVLPPQFMFGIPSAGWFGMLNASKRS